MIDPYGYDEEDLEPCPICKEKLPRYLMSPLVGSGIPEPICAVCALRIRNTEMELPPSMPFTGEMAQEMYEDTLEFIAVRRAIHEKTKRP